MINIIAEIFTIYAILLALLFVGVAVVGVCSFTTENRRRELLVDSDQTHSNEGSRIGISIIVSGYDSEQSLERLLSMDYSRYEVVMVCDMVRQPASVRLLEHYSMLEVEHTSFEEFRHPVPRALYRSRERRYNRLVLVDSCATTISDDFNCGVGVCSYEYVMGLNRWTLPHADALHRLALELHENWQRHVFAVGGFRSGELPHEGMAVVDYFVRMMVLGAGIDTISGLGHYMGESVLFEREAVIAVGGYRNDFMPDVELYARIRKMWTRTQARHISLFTPQVLAHESGTDRLTCSVIPLRHTPSGLSLVSRRTVLVYCLLTTLLLPIALFVGDYVSLAAFALILAVAYLSTVAVAIVSLVPMRIIVTSHGMSLPLPLRRVWLALPGYPFFLIRCLLWTKNFVKS